MLTPSISSSPARRPAALRGSAALADLRIELLDRLNALQMHLNPVREKAEVVKRVKSDAFWQNVTFADLELSASAAPRNYPSPREEGQHAAAGESHRRR